MNPIQKIKLAEKIFAEIKTAINETKSRVPVPIQFSQLKERLKLIEEKWTK